MKQEPGGKPGINGRLEFKRMHFDDQDLVPVQKQMSLEDKRLFMQYQDLFYRTTRGEPAVPRYVFDAVYGNYLKTFGHGQSSEELISRGGFSVSELLMHFSSPDAIKLLSELKRITDVLRFRVERAMGGDFDADVIKRVMLKAEKRGVDVAAMREALEKEGSKILAEYSQKDPNTLPKTLPQIASTIKMLITAACGK